MKVAKLMQVLSDMDESADVEMCAGIASFEILSVYANSLNPQCVCIDIQEKNTTL